MSYILEALRRAESERGRRRGVPGLHTQMPGVSADSGERRSRPWIWIVVGVSAGVLVPLLYRAVAGSDAPLEDAAQARAPVAGNVTPQATTNALPAANPGAASATASVPPAPTTIAPAATPGTTAAPMAAVPAAAVAAASAPATHASAAPKEPAARAAASSARASTATARANKRPAAAAAAQPPALPRLPPAPEARLPTLAELPDDLRRSVPALAFGGSVYSDVAAQRMVIFNGQVMREGDSVNDELLIEQIRARSAVMRLRGQRFEIPF